VSAFTGLRSFRDRQRSTDGAEKARPRSAIVSALICDTARLRNHLWFAGITYQGACFTLVAEIASSNASM
jgi:hypothetical protein